MYLRLTDTSSKFSSISVGSRNNPSLSEDTVFTCWYPSRLARWCFNNREASQEQAKTHHCWICRKASTRAESCQICRMLCVNTKGPEKCLWWSNLGSTRTSRATEEKEMYIALNNGLVHVNWCGKWHLQSWFGTRFCLSTHLAIQWMLCRTGVD